MRVVASLVLAALASPSHGLRLDAQALATSKYGDTFQYKDFYLLPRYAEKKLRVAFAVFITHLSGKQWEDGLAVMAHGVKKAAEKSRHQIELVAIVPESFEDKSAAVLKKVGFQRVLKKPLPVQLEEIGGNVHNEMKRIQGQGAGLTFRQIDETMKYWGLAMTEYDRVLMLDADVMVLDPMDELMERAEDFIGVYDHGLDSGSSSMPPTQGGFLLFRPNLTDFEAVKQLTREGDWGGSGWKGSGIGYCYGGTGPDGLLTYYFNKDGLKNIKGAGGKKQLPEGLDNPKSIEGMRLKAVDRPIYDVLVTQRLHEDLQHAKPEEVLFNVKSVHFTGDCIKPWTCYREKPGDWLCKGLMDKWWDLRADLERKRGMPPSPRKCVNGYQAIGGL